MAKNKQIKSNKNSDVKKPLSNKRVYKDQKPLWSFEKFDNGFLDSKYLFSEIANKLKFFEGMTWYEIESASGGKKNGTNSHDILINDIIKDAQKRLGDLHLDNEDVIFSLRINGTLRIWGFRRENILEIIWIDDNHAIYPSNRN